MSVSSLREVVISTGRHLRSRFLGISYLVTLMAMVAFLSGTVPSHGTTQSTYSSDDKPHIADHESISPTGIQLFKFKFAGLHSFSNINRLLFVMALNGVRPEIIEARLLISSVSCAMTATPYPNIAGESMLVFVLGDGCKKAYIPPGTPVSLLIKSAPTVAVRIASHVVSSNDFAEDKILEFANNSDSRVRGLELASIVPDLRLDRQFGPTLSRSALLAFMWGKPFTSTGIIALISCLITVYFIGSFALVRSRKAIASSIASFSICLALLSSWSILTPPLQAPDEATHFLTFFESTALHTVNRPNVLDWSNKIHFERIKFKSKEGFTGADTLMPMNGGWSPGTSALDMESRSALTFHTWQLLATALSSFSLPAGLWLLILRTTNVIAVAVAFLISSFAISKVLHLKTTHTPAIAYVISIFLIPTFAFFSMHVSNYGFSISGYIIVCASLFILVQTRDRDISSETICGALLGCGIAISTLASRSATPILLLPFFVALARGLFEQPNQKKASAFWLVAGITFLGIFACSGSVFQTRVNSALSIGITQLIGLDILTSHYWAPSALAVTILALWGMEYCVCNIHGRGNEGQVVQTSLTASRLVLLSILLLVAVASIISPGKLPNNEINQPLRGSTYVLRVAVRFFDQLSPFSVPDFYLTSSFWGGFGWLDRRIPPLVIYLFKLLPLGALCICGYRTIRDRSTGAAQLKLSTFFFTAIFLILVSAYAVSTMSEDLAVNLHGRYIIFAYLLLMLPMMRLVDSSVQANPQLPGLLLGKLLILHTVLWCWLMGRYFF